MKTDRHAKIIELIDRYEIETQEELAKRLMDAGYTVTQATVSRDIRELKLSKVMGSNGHQKYALLTKSEKTNKDKFTHALQDGFISSAVATNLVVIKTHPGMAMSIALALDAMDLQGMEGCIAGDDTVFCAIRSEEDAHHVIQIVNQIAGS